MTPVIVEALRSIKAILHGISLIPCKNIKTTILCASCLMEILI